MAGRLREETLDRVVEYGCRILNLADQLESERRPRRVIDQLIGSGTSVGANLFEAHEAMSKADFIKCLSIATKELHETMFWLRVMLRQGYYATDRLEPLLQESDELLAIVKTIIARIKQNAGS
jgi:four helix bundle protein